MPKSIPDLIAEISAYRDSNADDEQIVAQCNLMLIPLRKQLERINAIPTVLADHLPENLLGFKVHVTMGSTAKTEKSNLL